MAFLKKLNEKYPLFMEIVRFCIVGGLATVVDMVAMGVVLYLFDASLYPHFYNVWFGGGEPSTLATVVGTGVGFILGLFVNYFLSVLFVFTEKGKSKSFFGFTVFAVLSAIGLGIHLVGMYVGYDLLHINEWIVKIVLTAVVMVYNYVSKKLLLFKKGKEGGKGEAAAEAAPAPRVLQGESMKKLSVIVPCYNEEEVLPAFYGAAVPVLEKLRGGSYDFELIFVNDGSRDRTGEILEGFAEKDKRVKVLTFSRNFGQQAAILCGFRHATGNCAVELDADLQDPVEVIEEMLVKWEAGYDVVHGRRRSRKGESTFKKLTAKWYYKFLHGITGIRIPRNTGDFKLLDRKVLDVICRLPEHGKYLRGLESWVGFKQTFVDFDRNERAAGETKYTLKKMLRLAQSGIVSNSAWPLTLSFKCGMFLCVASVLCFIAFIVLVCCGVGLPLAAWIFPALALCTGCVCIFNSLTNLYLSRVYDEVKNRPEYIVSEKRNVDE